MSEGLEQIDKGIGADIDYLSYELKNKFKKLEPAEKEKKLKVFKNKVAICRRMLSTYELNIQMAPPKVQKEFEERYNRRAIELKQLEDEISGLKEENDNKQFLADVTGPMEAEMANMKRAEDMNQQELMNHGDKLFQKADRDLDDVTRMLMDGRSLQNETNQELQRMEEMLMKTQETVKDTQSLLKRSKALVNYFFRQIQTDKIICCCLIIVIMMILAVIIMSFAGVKSDWFNKKALPNQN
jgi:hypothetical protein